MRRLPSRLAVRAGLAAGAAAALAFLLGPLAVMLALSFTGSSHLRFPPQGLSLRWYRALLADWSYVDAFRVSLTVASGAALAAVLLGVPAALALARHEFRGRRAVQLFLTSPLVLPQVVIGASLLSLLSLTGVIRTGLDLLIAHVVIVVPYVVRTVSATLERFDRSVEEAARDLGASPPVAFLTVTVPLVKQGIVAGALFAFIVSWINVEVSMFLTSAERQTIPVKLFNYVQYSVDPLIAAVSAGTIYVAVVIVILIDATIGIERFVIPRG